MDLRRWEDLNTDCLVQVFKRVDTYTMLDSVQFVCKSWFKVSLHKECWENLDFKYFRARKHEYIARLYNNTGLIKLAVSRSCGTVTKAVLPKLFNKSALLCIVDKCPGLKSLELPSLGEGLVSYCAEGRWFLDILSKLKNLEVLDLGFVPSNPTLREILSVLKLQGNNLVSLSISNKNYESGWIEFELGSMIIELVPKIQYLTFGLCMVEREELLKILTSCTELVLFDIRGTDGFGCVELDEEILKKASHIKRFLFTEKGDYTFWDMYREF